MDEQKKIHETLVALRAQLNDINHKKEFWFQKKEGLKKDIKERVQQFRDYKNRCDKRNLELKALKTQRDKHNADVKELIHSIKKLNKQKYKALKKYNLKIDPTKLLARINELEKKVEVETNFDHEKKLMEEIKKLKKVYDECAEVIALANQANQLDARIKESRIKADEFHRKVLELAKDNDYSMFIHLSQQITELKKTQEEAFQIFIEYKNSYLKVAQLYNDQYNAFQALRAKELHHSSIRHASNEVTQRELLKERSLEIEEKIKTKKRLTTEDLLAFQGSTEA